MSYGLAPLCFTCEHFRGLERGRGWACRAFPDGIPADILINKVDHREPVEGDRGIQWQLRAGAP